MQATAASQTFTYRLMDTQFGFAVIRTEPTGYELVWEVVGRSKRKAAARLAFWQAA